MNTLINIQEDISRLHAAGVLDRLLVDKTTGKNIMWATDAYSSFGEPYGRDAEIKTHFITGAHAGQIKTRARKAFEQQSARTRQHAEVFTPLWVCKRMNDHADEVWFGRPGAFDAEDGPVQFPKGKKWQHYVDSRRLEITCGEAPYLVSRYDVATGEIIPVQRRIGILDRKLRVVSENTKTEEDWLRWAVRAFQATYGYEFQGDNLLIARVNMMMSFAEHLEYRWHREPVKEEYRKLANIVAWNLWQMDGLTGTLPYRKAEEEFPQFTFFDQMGIEPEELNRQPRNRIFDWRRENSLEFKCVNTGGRNMKFDFVIGNPPYQDETIGDNSKTPSIYNSFMDESYNISDVVELIHPARFLFNAGDTPKKWNEKMLNDPHFTVIYYEPTSGNIFPNTDIKGGIAISLRNKNKDYGAIVVFSKNQEMNSILRKVRNTVFQPFSSMVYSPVAFKFTEKMHEENPTLKDRLSKGNEYEVKTNVFETIPEVFFDDMPSNDDYVCILGRVGNARVYKYIKASYISNTTNLDSYKVALPEANGTGTFGEVLSGPQIEKPNVGFTQTFISIGKLKTEKEAQAVLAYIKTKFCRAMLGTLKVTQHTSISAWKNVPLQDFTPNSDIDWSKSIPEIDRQLYAKYGLSQEEIDFIESHVKEMS